MLKEYESNPETQNDTPLGIVRHGRTKNLRVSCKAILNNCYYYYERQTHWWGTKTKYRPWTPTTLTSFLILHFHSLWLASLFVQPILKIISSLKRVPFLSFSFYILRIFSPCFSGKRRKGSWGIWWCKEGKIHKVNTYNCPSGVLCADFAPMFHKHLNFQLLSFLPLTSRSYFFFSPFLSIFLF